MGWPFVEGFDGVGVDGDAAADEEGEDEEEDGCDEGELGAGEQVIGEECHRAFEPGVEGLGRGGCGGRRGRCGGDCGRFLKADRDGNHQNYRNIRKHNP